MKKSLKIAFYIIGVIVLVIIVAFVIGSSANNSQQSSATQQSNADKVVVAMGNTTTSYVFNSDGTVATTPASPLITFLINGSNQPLKVTAPASFTLTWKIDPSIDGSNCHLTGPYGGNSWGELYAIGSDPNHPTIAGANEFMKAQGGNIGSLGFQNVTTGTWQTAPIYQGVAQFLPGANTFGIECVSPQSKTGVAVASVSVWINQ